MIEPAEAPADPRHAGIATGAGLVVLLLVVALDVLTGADAVIITGVLIGPLVAIPAATPRQVAALGGLGVAAALLSAAWNDNAFSGAWAAHVVIVAAGAVAAVLAARSRAGEAAARAQLGAVLATLAEAVTVQDASGRLIFANQAAADLMGYTTADELLAGAGPQTATRWETVREDGRPVRTDDLPGRRVLAGEAHPEPLLVRVRHPETGEERWRVVKASGVRDRAGNVRHAVNVIDDLTDVKRAELSLRLLSEASRILAGSLDARATLQRLARAVVPDLADWCVVHVPREDGVLEVVAVAHADPERTETARRSAARRTVHVDDEGDVARAARLGEVRFLPDIPPEALAAAARDDEHLRELEAVGMRSAMVVPLPAAGRPRGALTLVTADSRRRFTDDDLELAVELGRRAGVALANAELYEDRAATAEALERELLPPDLPAVDGWALAALYRAAGEVGGDFYDVFEAGDGWFAVMGDVAGRGPVAASLTAMARHTLRTAGALTGDAGATMALLNRALAERQRLSLVSVCLVRVHGSEREGELDVLCAGHPPPFVVRAGRAKQVPAAGPLLGALASASWPAQRVVLDPGDELVLYTDGVTDAVGPGGRFGEQGVQAALEGATSAEAAVEQLRAALDALATGSGRDDTAVLALARAGAIRQRLRLDAGGHAPRTARQAVQGWLDGVLAPERLEDAKLLVSELVTNGVRHVRHGLGDRLELDLLVRDDTVRVEVRDAGHGFRPSAPATPSPERPGGRGLLIVDRVASRWGVGAGDRTCVWFELDR